MPADGTVTADVLNYGDRTITIDPHGFYVRDADGRHVPPDPVPQGSLRLRPLDTRPVVLRFDLAGTSGPWQLHYAWGSVHVATPLVVTTSATKGAGEFSESSQDFVFVVALLVAAVTYYRNWPFSLNRMFGKVPNPGLGLVRAAILLTIPWFVLVSIVGAASDVVGSYVVFYAVLAYACLAAGSFWFPILGISHRADVFERANLAAGVVVGGFVGGTMFAFGGALTGEGPGWIVVAFFFVLAYTELRLNVGLVSRLSGRLAEAVRRDRDLSAAVLLAGVCLATGLIAGRAAAGDFLGWIASVKDYLHRLWPIVLVPIVAALIGFLTEGRRHALPARGATAGALTAFGAYWYFFT